MQLNSRLRLPGIFFIDCQHEISVNRETAARNHDSACRAYFFRRKQAPTSPISPAYQLDGQN